MKRSIIVLAVLLAANTLAAQDLNPSVSVTNKYKAQGSDLQKIPMTLSVPDSAMRFDYDFDYSVFANPYKSASKFDPYIIDVKPDAREFDGSRFYLRSGAGYSVYPELQAVFAPYPRQNFSMSVYQDFGGKPICVDADGYDLSEKFGVETRWGKEKYTAFIGADYYGIYTSCFNPASVYHSAGLAGRLKSNDGGVDSFSYDFALSARFATENEVKELETDASLFIGPKSRTGNFLSGEILASNDQLLGALNSNQAGLHIVPQFNTSFWVFDAVIGLKVSTETKFGTEPRVFVHPDVRLSYGLFKDRIKGYLSITGEARENNYSSFKFVNHCFSNLYSNDFQSVTNELVNVAAGFDGRIGDHYQYSLKGGWAYVKDNPFECVGESVTVGYYDCQLLYADFLSFWNWERLTANLALNFRKTDVQERQAVCLPLLSGRADVKYNFAKRIYIGVDADAASAREYWRGGMVSAKIPAFVNLGVNAEYVFAQNFSLWLRGGNLLNQRIERNVYVTDVGINFTAGLCLKF